MKPALSRRRFLVVSAAAMATPATATPLQWRGYALGAETSLTIHAPYAQAEQALQDIRTLLTRVESLFSLYDPASLLSHLNRVGALDTPPTEFNRLLFLAGRVHGATGGLFDPTIQPLWHALATGAETTGARSAIGWDRVRIAPDRLELGTGQALTFNGIAQGFATDLATRMLRRGGLQKVLVNIGEFAALGGPFTLGISDPVHGLLDTTRLCDNAIATSSPAAMALGANQSHILHPILKSRPQWSTISVEATSAAIADAASTAFCLMSEPAIRAGMKQLPEISRVTLVDPSGNVAKIF